VRAQLSAQLLAGIIALGDPSDTGSSGKIIQYVLVGLLLLLAAEGAGLDDHEQLVRQHLRSGPVGCRNSIVMLRPRFRTRE
jgi:hypothetical protein